MHDKAPSPKGSTIPLHMSRLTSPQVLPHLSPRFTSAPCALLCRPVCRPATEPSNGYNSSFGHAAALAKRKTGSARS